MFGLPCVVFPHPSAVCGGYGTRGALPDAVWRRLRELQGQLRQAQKRAQKAEASLANEEAARRRLEAALASERNRGRKLQCEVRKAVQRAAAAEARCCRSRAAAVLLPDSPRNRSSLSPPEPQTLGSLLPLESPRTRGSLLPLESPRTRGSLLPLESPRTRGSLLPLESPQTQELEAQMGDCALAQEHTPRRSRPQGDHNSGAIVSPLGGESPAELTVPGTALTPSTEDAAFDREDPGAVPPPTLADASCPGSPTGAANSAVVAVAAASDVTGGAARVSAAKALLIDHVAYWVSVYMPYAARTSWARVCSATCRVSVGVMDMYAAAWDIVYMAVGSFQSLGFEDAFCSRNFGPAPGPVHAARVELLNLKRSAMHLQCSKDETKNVFALLIDFHVHLYAEISLKHRAVLHDAYSCINASYDFADSLELALKTRTRRTEAEDAQ